MFVSKKFIYKYIVKHIVIHILLIVAWPEPMNPGILGIARKLLSLQEQLTGYIEAYM
jgi:hypothetical protein